MSMNKRTLFYAFTIGGLAGAVAGLLFAPQSGEETRQILRDNGQEIKDKSLEAIQETQNKALSAIKEAQVHFEVLNQDTRERLARLQNISQSRWGLEKESLEKVVQES